MAHPLKDWCSLNDQSMAQFARDLGHTPGALNNWLHGQKRMSAYTAEQIRELTGGAVKLKDWPWLYFPATGDIVDQRPSRAAEKAAALKAVQDTLTPTPTALEDAKKAVEEVLESLKTSGAAGLPKSRLTQALTLAVAARAQINSALGVLHKEMKKVGATTHP